MPFRAQYIKAHLMTESEMKLYELMYEQQPPRVLNANQLRWKVDGGIWGWLNRQLQFLERSGDFNRKV